MINLRRRTDDRGKLLRNIDLFSGCSNDELRRIGSLSMEMEMEKGTVLVEEDQTGLEFFVVVKGSATATRQGLWLANFGPGSFFGELALVDGGRRTATVVADTDMSLLVFSRAEFSSLRGVAPSVAFRMVVELSRRLRRTNELLEEESVCAPSLRPMILLSASGG
jgi:CRP-like cAMP-binding protein